MAPAHNLGHLDTVILRGLGVLRVLEQAVREALLDNGFLVPLAFVVEVVANERIVIDPPEGLFDE